MMPRRKIAMVTPLPPERTGIADYVATLLPALAQHFDIDLYTTAELDKLGALGQRFAVHPWQELEARRGRYDQVIYQFGNSPFHSHMLGMLDRLPGVVVLHDFYLSSMIDYMDAHQGHPGLFKAELQRSHGRKAVSLLAKQGPAEALKRYPASRRVIERAVSVVVHSEHSGELRAEFYPDLPGVAWHGIPMPQSAVPPATADARRACRSRLGVAESDFLVVSLGFIADTKLNHELADALADKRLSTDRDLRVVFVGENDPREYGDLLKQKIAGLPNHGRITITGFVDADTYRDYLVAADCAVQLRTRSRGETSKAVYDCMSHGLPVIVNDYASFHELPDEAVSKIGAGVKPRELADALHALRQDPLRRAVLGMSARQHMASTHLAHLVAAQYAAVIEQSLDVQARPDGIA